MFGQLQQRFLEHTARRPRLSSPVLEESRKCNETGRFVTTEKNLGNPPKLLLTFFPLSGKLASGHSGAGKMPSKKKQHGCVPSALGPSRISMSALSDNGGPIPPAVFSMNHSCEVPKASGIYAIVNCVNGKRYVGSAVNFRRRLYGHRSHLRRGTHHNHHLQTAWVKYGHDAFVFFILEYVEIPML